MIISGKISVVLAGIGKAVRYGIIIRSGDALERLSRVKRIAFDKTGTITYGKPEVVAYKSLTPELTDDEVLKLAALTEQKSERPIGKAIVGHYVKTGNQLSDVTDFKVTVGNGVSAVIDSKKVWVGKQSDDTDNNTVNEELSKGSTVVFVTVHDKTVGYVSLRDALREDARETIKQLKENGIKTV